MVGTRFFARGGDSKGNVANFCETEQLLEHAGQVGHEFFHSHDKKGWIHQIFQELLGRVHLAHLVDVVHLVHLWLNITIPLHSFAVHHFETRHQKNGQPLPHSMHRYRSYLA